MQEQATTTEAQMTAELRNERFDGAYPMGLSQMAEDMGYDLESAIAVDKLQAGLDDRKHTKRKKNEWVLSARGQRPYIKVENGLQKMRDGEELHNKKIEEGKKNWALKSKSTAPKEFYVWLRVPHMNVKINTFEFGEARGKWNSIYKATAFCKAKLTEANKNWQDLYTFQYSFVPAKNGVMVMIPSIRRKMSEQSRFMSEGGRIQLARTIDQKEETDYTMTNNELEQAIINGELDNVDIFVEDKVGEFQDAYKEAQMEAKTWKHIATTTNEASAWAEYKKANQAYKLAYKKIQIVRSRRNAYNQYDAGRINDEFDLREKMDAYECIPRDTKIMNELELAWAKVLGDREDLLAHLKNRANPQVLLNEEVMDMLQNSDISDYDMAIISVDLLGEPNLPTPEELMKDGEQPTRAILSKYEAKIEGMREEAATVALLIHMAETK